MMHNNNNNNNNNKITPSNTRDSFERKYRSYRFNN
jgi:hypothetical protein